MMDDPFESLVLEMEDYDLTTLENTIEDVREAMDFFVESVQTIPVDLVDIFEELVELRDRKEAEL